MLQELEDDTFAVAFPYGNATDSCAAVEYSAPVKLTVKSPVKGPAVATAARLPESPAAVVYARDTVDTVMLSEPSVKNPPETLPLSVSALLQGEYVPVMLAIGGEVALNNFRVALPVAMRPRHSLL